MTNKTYNVAVVGATGVVGREMIAILEERAFPTAKLKPLASARARGTAIRFHNANLAVEELTHASFEGIDIALFSAGSTVSREFAPLAAHAGAVVIDNKVSSSCFFLLR